MCHQSAAYASCYYIMLVRAQDVKNLFSLWTTLRCDLAEVRAMSQSDVGADSSYSAPHVGSGKMERHCIVWSC